MLRAVVTGCDTHPIRSLAMMLKSVGYEVSMLTDEAMDKLRKRGYPGGVDANMLNGMGYVNAGLPSATETDLETCDLFVDIKKVDADAMLKLYPRLVGKTIIFLINGGWDDYEDYGDFYPVVTSNFWVKTNAFKVYMPFDNIHNLQPREKITEFEPPIGLLHNARKWGFGHIIDEVMARTGLRVYGSYDSPAGMLTNDKVGEKLSKALCFIHLKASDCPGYALYEAMASGVPVVVTELFIDRMQFSGMYVKEKTCLTWGREAYEITNNDRRKIVEHMYDKAGTMIEGIVRAVERLKDPELNYEIGHRGYEHWKSLTEWNEKKQEQFKKFLHL